MLTVKEAAEVLGVPYPLVGREDLKPRLGVQKAHMWSALRRMEYWKHVAKTAKTERKRRHAWLRYNVAVGLVSIMIAYVYGHPITVEIVNGELEVS
jgi:hypothetical protein